LSSAEGVYLSRALSGIVAPLQKDILAAPPPALPRIE